MKKLRELFCLILCSCGICVNVSAESEMSAEERLKHEARIKEIMRKVGITPIPPEVIAKEAAVEAHIARVYSEFGDDALPELYKVLEENIKDVYYASHIANRLSRDAMNPAVESDARILRMMRMVVDAGTDTSGWGRTYLALKGDASDLVRLRDAYILNNRVAGTNLFGDIRFYTRGGPTNGWGIGGKSTFRPPFVPSVANTGPQALYVYEILKSFWEQNGKDESKILDEPQISQIFTDYRKNTSVILPTTRQ